MSMVDGFPYKEEVGGSSPSVPTIDVFDKLFIEVPLSLLGEGSGERG